MAEASQLSKKKRKRKASCLCKSWQLIYRKKKERLNECKKVMKAKKNQPCWHTNYPVMPEVT